MHVLESCFGSYNSTLLGPDPPRVSVEARLVLNVFIADQLLQIQLFWIRIDYGSNLVTPCIKIKTTIMFQIKQLYKFK